MSAREFEGHEELVAQLRAGTLEAPDHLHRRVLALGSAKRRGRVRVWASTPRRRLMLVLPVAAAVAVGAALVHGAFFSGNTSDAKGFVAAGLAQIPQPSAPHGSSSEKKPSKLGTQASLGYRADKTAVNSAPTPANHGGDALAAGGPTVLSQKAYRPVTIPTNRLVHAAASLQVVVPSHAALTSATNKASQIVTQLGGYAQNVQYQTSKGGDGNAFLDLRVPVGKAETAIGRLGALGKLVSQQVATQDLQQTFSKESSTIGSLKRAIAVYEQALNSGSVTGAQRVEVQIRLSNAEHSLTSERKARGRTVASGATADIQLQLTTNQHAFAVGHHKQGRLGRLLGNAGSFLGLEGVIILYALIVAAPFIILGALGWGLVRERRLRDERRLLASA